MLVQPRICATKTGPTGQKQRMFQEEDGFDFRDAAARRLISAELRRFSADSVTVHPPDVVCRSGFFSQESAEGTRQVQTFGQSCVQSDSRSIEKRETGFLGCALVPSEVEQSVKLKSGLDLKNLPKTVSLEQVKTLVRELEQKDVCDMEVDLAEVRWQESDVEMLNVFAQDLETAVECLPAEEDEDEDVNMRGDEHHDGSDVEEQVPMEEGGEHDEAAPEGEVHSRHDVERVKRALRKLHTNLGHPGEKEMVRVLKHGRASELAIQEARRMHCDISAENVQPKLERPAIPRQVLDFNERVGLNTLSLPHRSGATRSVKCLNIVCHGFRWSFHCGRGRRLFM